MKTIEEIVILNIKELMRRRGLSQRQLAKDANMKAPSLSQMLKGKRPIGDKVRTMLAKALKVDPESLRHERIEEPIPISKQKELIAKAYEALTHSEFFSLWDVFQKIEPRHRVTLLKRAQFYLKDTQNTSYGKILKKKDRDR